jgi:hypothetical protein
MQGTVSQFSTYWTGGSTIFTFFWHLKKPTVAWFFLALGYTASIESGWIIFHPTIWPANLGQWMITLLVAACFFGTVTLNALTFGSALAELQLRSNLKLASQNSLRKKNAMIAASARLGEKLAELDKSGVLNSLRSHTIERARRAELADDLERQLVEVREKGESAQAQVVDMTSRLAAAERELAVAHGELTPLREGFVSLARFLIAQPGSNGRMALLCRVDPAGGGGTGVAPMWRLADAKTGSMSSWALPAELVLLFREQVLTPTPETGGSSDA